MVGYNGEQSIVYKLPKHGKEIGHKQRESN